MKNILATVLLVSVGSIASAAQDYTFVCSNSTSDYVTVDVRYDIPDKEIRYSTMSIYQPGQQPKQYKAIEGDSDDVFAPDNRGWWERHQSGAEEGLKAIGSELPFFSKDPVSEDEYQLVVTLDAGENFKSAILYLRTKNRVGLKPLQKHYAKCSR